MDKGHDGNAKRKRCADDANLPRFRVNARHESGQGEDGHQIEACGVVVDNAAHQIRVDKPHGHQNREPMKDLSPDEFDTFLLGFGAAPAQVDANRAINGRYDLP